MDTPDSSTDTRPTELPEGWSWQGDTTTDTRVATRDVRPEDSLVVAAVVTPTGVTLVDTGADQTTGRHLRDQWEAAGTPVVQVILSHGHPEQTGGLAAFADLPILAHEDAELPDLELPALQTFGLITAVAADGSTGAEGVIDRHRLEACFFGKAHTAGDVVVHVPAAGVALVGDLVGGAHPRLDRDSTLSTWPSAIDGVMGLMSEAGVAVPARGKPLGKQELFLRRADLAGLFGEAEHLISSGVKREDARRAITEDADAPDIDLPDEVWDTGLDLAYAELAARGVVPRTHLPLFGV
ncbi:MBL fold metallo-hydrolase [Parenemella sanctibonifatiensis]|uniref:Metallo-beta-lactamase domain-containing protein n=1 Tax=Parenemella sanctibonifatiensis TaxID=2016505 RepID=A0A255EKC5_9ACTN|nr:MBL fold metallo-hydrolase [Parenemella sanctibonifatiensis]OYN91988.1 hypothetical protein CGZ91_00175 [Parenemella sanctibonifatiensis]